MPGNHSRAAAHRTIDRQWWVQRLRDRRAVTHLGSRARPMPYRRQPLRTRERTSPARSPRRRHPVGPNERRKAGGRVAFCSGTCSRRYEAPCPLPRSGRLAGEVCDLRRQQDTCERRQGLQRLSSMRPSLAASASTVGALALARCGPPLKCTSPEGAQWIAARERSYPRNAHQTLPNDVQGDHPDNLDRIG